MSALLPTTSVVLQLPFSPRTCCEASLQCLLNDRGMARRRQAARRMGQGRKPDLRRLRKGVSPADDLPRPPTLRNLTTCRPWTLAWAGAPRASRRLSPERQSLSSDFLLIPSSIGMRCGQRRIHPKFHFDGTLLRDSGYGARSLHAVCPHATPCGFGAPRRSRRIQPRRSGMSSRASSRRPRNRASRRADCPSGRLQFLRSSVSRTVLPGCRSWRSGRIRPSSTLNRNAPADPAQFTRLERTPS